MIELLKEKTPKRREEKGLVNGTSKARICVTFTRICLRHWKSKYNLRDSMLDLRVPGYVNGICAFCDFTCVECSFLTDVSV